MTNIVIAGVGGQGSIFTAKILGSLYMARGLDVKLTEVHGMAQRGGSVVTMMKAGETVCSPLVSAGEADYLIGLEATEAARTAELLAPQGAAFVSSRTIPIAGQSAVYAVHGDGWKVVDALGIATEAGNPRCENAVLLGAFSNAADFTEDEWEAAIRANVKPNLADVNLKAFKMGQSA
ncbi:MAG: indolepyruvate oxidoreductase subunit beta [Oscillospiraceae bacterium]|nr:indolepyruvate oxidoreductase subunit beta [Oscillospiraceae bacterium]